MNRDAKLRLVESAQQLSLKLYSLGQLEILLGVSRETLFALANIAGSRYQKFIASEKFRPFQKKTKPPKKRQICNPKTDLKKIQKRINKRLLKTLDLPHYLCGGVKGRTLLDNVLHHHGASLLVTVDIKNFFPSISNLQVYRVWNVVLGCSPEISALLTRLTTFERRLPQGAPTSTLLANLVLHSIDGPIRRECERAAVRYTSWVDDLAFSGGDSRAILEVVIPTLHRSGFLISRKKLKIMGPGDRKTLTGVLIGRFPSVLGERLAQIRSGIHKLEANQVASRDIVAYVGALRSRIAQIRTIYPSRSDKLKFQLEAVLRKQDAESETCTTLNLAGGA